MERESAWVDSDNSKDIVGKLSEERGNLQEYMHLIEGDLK